MNKLMVAAGAAALVVTAGLLQMMRTGDVVVFDPAPDGEDVETMLLASPGGATYSAIKTYFPEDAEYWRDRTVELLREQSEGDETADEAIAVGAEIRRRHAPSLASAPDPLLIGVLNYQTGMISQFRDTPETCNMMLTAGPAGLSQAELNALAPHLETADIIYRAMHAGTTEPVGRDASTDGDWTNLFETMAQAGLTEDQIALVVDPDPTDAGLCEAMLGFLEAVSSADFPGADRLRAEIAVAMLGS